MMTCGELSSLTGTVKSVRHRDGLSAHTTPESEPKLAVSRSLRLQILRRDNHTCQSCGAKAPDVALEVDHVLPVALGGSDEPSNLRTLCEACNSGKAATPPDAATVAKVSEDAVRWSQAIKAAADNMLAAHGAQSAVYAQIESAWNGSPNGRYRPLPTGWERSIDSFLAAGLPMAVLNDVVEIALSRERQDAWRYFCGVAWAKVRELQDAAKALMGGGVDPESDDYDEDLDPQLAPGRESLASTILGSIAGGTADLEARIERERIWLDDEETQAPRSKLIIAAAQAAVSEVCGDLYRLMSAVEDLLAAHPDDYIVALGDEATAAIADRYGEQGGEMRRGRIAVEMVQILVLRQAREYLEAMPSEEMAEWLDYAVAWYGQVNPWDASVELAEELKVKYAAQVARVIKDGFSYTSMCTARGQHIEACPRRAKFRVYIAELECCAPENEHEHEGHRLCEQHLEQMVDGFYMNRNGKSFTARDFAELGDA